jgi:hypothetical protein
MFDITSLYFSLDRVGMEGSGVGSGWAVFGLEKDDGTLLG